MAPVLVTVGLRDKATGQTERLTCTPEHPLFVRDKGWAAAGALCQGSQIVTRAGPALTVSGLGWQRAGETTGGNGASPSPGGTQVYNFEVEGTHAYFVGDTGGGILAHNITCPMKKLQHEFSHAADFGITGNWNKANGQLFEQAIQDHVASAWLETQGTYRGNIPVTHYFDPATRLWAAADSSGTLVAGWKLTTDQAWNLIHLGNVQ